MDWAVVVACMDRIVVAAIGPLCHAASAAVVGSSEEHRRGHRRSQTDPDRDLDGACSISRPSARLIARQSRWAVAAVLAGRKMGGNGYKNL